MTGGSGTLGRAIVNRLVATGIRVAVLDKNEYDGNAEIEYFCKADIRDRRAVIEATRGIVTLFFFFIFRKTVVVLEDTILFSR